MHCWVDHRESAFFSASGELQQPHHRSLNGARYFLRTMVSQQVLVLVPFGWLFLYIMGTFNSHVNHVQWVHRVNETIQRNPSFVHISPAGKARKGSQSRWNVQPDSLQTVSWNGELKGNIFFMMCCVCVKSLQACRTLCDPMDCSPPGSSVRGVLQARILEWVAMPSSSGSSWPPGIEPMSLTFPALAGVFFTTSTTWEAPWQWWNKMGILAILLHKPLNSGV